MSQGSYNDYNRGREDVPTSACLVRVSILDSRVNIVWPKGNRDSEWSRPSRTPFFHTSQMTHKTVRIVKHLVGFLFSALGKGSEVSRSRTAMLPVSPNCTIK